MVTYRKPPIDFSTFPDSDGEPVAIPPDLRVYSPALGADLRVLGRWLRLIDPRTGRPVPFPQEYQEALLHAEQTAQQEARARRDAEQRAAREAQARLAAEEQAQRARAQLEAALERLRRLDAGDAGTPAS